MQNGTGVGLSKEIYETGLFPFNPLDILLLEDGFFFLLEDLSFLWLE
jgi:hypothetical protein